MWAAGAAILVCLSLGAMPALAQEASIPPGPVVVAAALSCTAGPSSP